MSTTAIAPAGSAEMVSEDRPPSLARAVLRSAEGRIGLGLGLVLLLVVVVGPLVAPYDPNAVGTGPATAGPSAAHLLGTDQLGRDVFSRFVNGGRSVLLVPLAAVTLALVVGGGLGLLGAYLRGLPDTIIARTFDLLNAVPTLLVVLVLIAGLGTSVGVIILTVALAFTPRIGRIVRGAGQAAVTNEYVTTARLRGESTAWILGREILPNVAGAVLAVYALYLTYGIIYVATLSFLGLGAQPPSSDWGLMVAESRPFLAINPWATLTPAFAIAALAVAFTMVADAVNRHLARAIEQSGSAL
ncbi:MAG: ABC transporter permease [Solirubrobacteraceae bacterium]